MMTVQENMQRIKNLESEIESHPCCLAHEQVGGCSTVIFPVGYTWKGVDGVRVSMGCKRDTLLKVLSILEECWNDNGLR